MITPELLDYIRQQHTNGNSFEDIRSAVLKEGWQEADVDDALHQIRQDPHGLTLDSLTALFQQVLDIYKKRWKTLIGILLLSRIALSAVALAGLLIFALVYTLSRELGTALVVPLLLLLFIALIIWQLWESLALLDAITSDTAHPGILGFLHRTKGRLFSYSWLLLLQMVLTLGAFFLFFLPGLIFAVWFSFASYIFLLEGETGIRAMLKSREYVRHLWLPVAWRILLGVLCVALFSAGVAATPSLLLTPIQFMMDPASVLTVGGNAASYTPSLSIRLMGIFSSLIVTLLSLFLSPLLVIYYYVLYRNVRGIKGQISLPVRASARTYFVVAAVGWLLVVCLGALVLWVYGLEGRTRRQDFYAQGRDSRRLTDQQELTQALQEYLHDHGAYPPTLSTLSPHYMTMIPQDPDGVTFYGYSTEGQTYRICVTLELKGLQCTQGTPQRGPSPVMPWEQVNRDRIRDAHLLQLSQALDQYYLDEKDYPLSFDGLVPEYIIRLPMDPKTNERYMYTRIKNGYGTFYEVCANFETRGRECIPAG